MNKSLKRAGLLLLIAFTGYQSVYIKSLKEVKAKENNFDAKAYAERFYRNQILPLADSALSLTDLLVMLHANKEEAFNRYGHSLSIGSIYYFLVKGEGIATAVETNTVRLKTPADSLRTSVQVATEFVFGNAIRDASGKISLAAFTNLSDVNNISMELNKIVRDKVLPPFKKSVTTGSRIRFYGAVQLNKERLNLDEVEIIPIQLAVVQK